MKPIHGWLMVPLLAACAASAPHWEKSGASETAMADDLQQCRVGTMLLPQQHLGPTPMSSGTPLMDRGQERDAQEAQQISRCMQEKGYSAKR